MIVCGLEDLFPSAVKIFMEKDEETKVMLHACIFHEL
jgi:hypothetical protein